MRARAARLLAVRRVSQDNRGKRTAGVDGVKALTPTARLALAEDSGAPGEGDAHPTGVDPQAGDE